MKILLITEYYWPQVGGVEVVFQNLAERLVAEGHVVEVVTCRLKGTVRKEVRGGVTIHRVRVPRLADRYWFSLLSIPTVIRLAKKKDIIHGTVYGAAFPTWFAGKWCHKKTVLTIHEILGSQWKKMHQRKLWFKLHRWMEKVLLKLKFSAYVAVSQSTHKEARKILPSRLPLKTIHNGIDESFNAKKYDRRTLREKWGWEKDFIFLYYGRPGISKGVEFLVEAASSILRTFSKSKLVLVLSPRPHSGHQKIKTLVEIMHFGDQIEILSPLNRETLNEIIVAADTGVVPSLSEGFGFSAAESCALGTPVVVSRVASLPEVVSGKVIFVEPGNVKSLEEGLQKAVEGKFERIPRKHFSWQKNVQEHLKLYKSLSV